MTLEDRLERLSRRTPEGDPSDVLAGARRRAEVSRDQRTGSPRVLAAAAAVLAVVALGAGALALTGDGSDTVTVAGPDDRSEASSEDPLVTVSLDGLPSVEASTSPLRPSGQGWAEHTVTLRNTGSEPARLSDFRGGDILGDDEVAVAHGCNYSGSRELACLTNIQPVTIDAGDAYEFTVTLWRDLAGMNPVTAGPHVWRLDVYPADNEDAAPAAIIVTYRNLDALIGAEPNPTGGVDGPVMYAPASHSDRMEFAQLTGQLGREGDCLYLLPPPTARDPLAEPLLWPYGSTWEDSPAGVRLADGTFVPVGASFSAAGGMHGIDRLTAEGHHPDVAERASECARQNTGRPNADSVAYVQGEFEVTGDPERDADWRPVPIDTFEVLDDASLNLTLGYCTDDHRVRVDESEDTVTLTAEAAGPSGGYCLTLTTVELRRPLGNRTVVDAFTGETVDRRPTDAPAGADGDTAVWDVDAADPPTPSATSITAMVSRLGCSGGETGEVLAPVVSADAERVVLTFSVEPLPDDVDYTCPGNPAVPYVVELDEPLGDRELVDGACLSGDAASTSHCSDGAVRWPAPA